MISFKTRKMPVNDPNKNRSVKAISESALQKLSLLLVQGQIKMLGGPLCPMLLLL